MADSGSGRNRRRIYVIHKRYQYGQLARIGLALFIVLLFSFLASLVLQLLWTGVRHDPWSEDLPEVMGLLALVYLGVTLFFSIRFSHRIAGPMYRIRVSCERVMTGDLRFPVRFRKYDPFQEVGETFSRMLEYLEHRESERVQLVRELRDRAHRIGEGLGAGGTPTILEDLRAIEQRADEFLAGRGEREAQ